MRESGLYFRLRPMYDSKRNEIFEFKTAGSATLVPDQRKVRLDVMERAVEKK
jgi:hypothetical protein